MSSMRSNKKVIAIFCADLHLSLTPPIWRLAEPDWFAAMKRLLNEIRDLQEKYNCLVICAGDIFDRWNSLPELINFALEYLPDKMIAIPGQHDLPLHIYNDMQKSAYWTLVKAGKIQNILSDFHVKIGQMVLHGFPFGFPITPLAKEWEGDRLPAIHIAVVHEYVWVDGYSYPNAPIENRLHNTTGRHKWMGYDIIIYGDNHLGFSTCIGQTSIFNCGTLMRRKSDEIKYEPQVGLLLSSGKIEQYHLDISKDKYLDIQDSLGTETSLDMKAFIQELEKLGDTDLDFHDAMKQYLKKNKVKESVCNIILKAME